MEQDICPNAFNPIWLTFSPRDARSAKHGIATVSRPSVRPIRSSETQHRQSSPRETPQNSDGIGVGCCFQQSNCNISETGQDRTKVIIDD